MLEALEFGGGPGGPRPPSDRLPSAWTLLKVAVIGGLIGEAAGSLGEIIADAIDPWIGHLCGMTTDAARRRVLLRHAVRAIVLVALAAVAIRVLLPRRRA